MSSGPRSVSSGYMPRSGSEQDSFQVTQHLLSPWDTDHAGAMSRCFSTPISPKVHTPREKEVGLTSLVSALLSYIACISGIREEHYSPERYCRVFPFMVPSRVLSATAIPAAYLRHDTHSFPNKYISVPGHGVHVLPLCANSEHGIVGCVFSHDVS